MLSVSLSISRDVVLRATLKIDMIFPVAEPMGKTISILRSLRYGHLAVQALYAAS